MALTYNNYTGDGVQTVYDVPFTLGYLRREFVYVYLAGDDYNTQLEYTWLNSNTIVLTEAVKTGIDFIIRRVVPRSKLVNEYEDGAILRDSNIDESFLQSLMIIEEIQDGYLSPNDTAVIATDLDMLLKYQVRNLATPRLSRDAATKEYVDVESTARISADLELQSQIIGEPTGGDAITRNAVARSVNVSDPEVIFSTDVGTSLDGKKYIYNVLTQKLYERALRLSDGEVLVSVVDDTLTTNVATYTLVEVVHERTLDSTVPKLVSRHRGMHNHTHKESVKVSPTIQAVDLETAYPPSIGSALLDVVNEELYLGTGKQYLPIPTTQDSRYFFMLANHKLTLAAPYTGTVTLEVYPNGGGNVGVHPNCPTLIDHTWNTVSFTVTSEDTLFTTGAGVYFSGLVKSVTLDDIGQHQECDRAEWVSSVGAWEDARSGTLLEKIKRTVIKFHRDMAGNWVSEDILRLDNGLIIGTGITRVGDTYTFAGVNSGNFVKLTTDEYSYPCRVFIDVTDITDSLYTVAEDAGLAQYRGQLQERRKFEGILSKDVNIKAFGGGILDMTCTITRANYIIEGSL